MDSLNSKTSSQRLVFLFVLYGLWMGLQPFNVVAQNEKLVLKPNDRIAIIGNTLADRMQHDGWLEHNLQIRFPDLKLSVRNLGFSADTIDVRLRSSGFGTPDEHLQRIGADVVFMMFGFNESFDGADGVEQFKAKYDAEVKRMLTKQYNGDSAPRLVLISPIAQEKLENPDLTDGSVNNANLEQYTKAIKAVAADNKLPFVDVFSSTAAAYSALDQPLTINGIHLNSTGNQFVANNICLQLFGEKTIGERAAVRNAILQKNFNWFEYYRATDGYSIFGGRGDLKFVDGQTNREVMTRELEILIQMTDNRDPVIWAAVENRVVEPDDSKLLPFIPVVTNKPGNGPEGQHKFLTGEDAIKKMRVLEGFAVNLFASEEMFPEFVNPAQMAFDTKGRLWVAVWPSYPHWKPKDEMNDKLLILEDTDGDGRADVCKVFADKLHNPTGFEFYNGGVLIAQAPDIMFLKDTNGDDIVDVRQRILHGIDSADTHHTSNSFVMGQDGAFYFQEGVFHHTQIETPYGPLRNVNAGSYRFEPRTFRVDAYTPFGYANPHGHVFDRWGRDIIHDGTSSNPYDAAITSGHLEHPNKHPGAPLVYSPRTRPCPATEIVSGEHFPIEMNDELLVENVIGDLGILRYKITDKGSSIEGTEQPALLLSDDPNFRPVDLEFAPDGSLYLIDWQNPIIGHMQHNLRDPSRDRVHGRAYRITHKGSPLQSPAPASELSTPALIERICTATHRERYRARIELTSRPDNEVMAAVIARLPRCQDDSERMELLWLHQQANQVNESLLDQMLSSKEDWIRAAATRVVTYQCDRISTTGEKLAKMASDPSSRVRLMAARGASFLESGSSAMHILSNAYSQPRDNYLDYVIRESLRAVNPSWKKDIGTATWPTQLSEASLAFVFDQLTPTELRDLQLTPEIARYLLLRPGLGDAQRRAAVDLLAKAQNVSTASVLITAIQDSQGKSADRSLIFDLVRALAAESAENLQPERASLVELATAGQLNILRQVGWIGTMLADKEVETVWKMAEASPQQLNDVASALSLLPDPVLQADLYSRVAPLSKALPDSIAKQLGDSKSKGLARFVRIELPGKNRILTLAEVEVLSGGENIARLGSATQSSTSHNGTADRAIDGDANPDYQSGKQTHTQETTANPWWQLELGQDSAIDEIRVFNRVEGDLGNRLKDFTVSVLDSNHQVLFTLAKNPAPTPMSEFKVDLADMSSTIRRSAIDSISQVRGKEGDAFNRLSELIINNDERPTAIRAIQRIPVRFWNSDAADSLGQAVLEHLNALPEAERASESAAEYVQLGQTVATMLPEEAAAGLKKQISKLGVEVLRLGTKPHRMAYDKPMMVVEAGKPVVVLFENTDMMPHNFVLTIPGAMEEMGQLAEAEALKPGALESGFVPNSTKVLAHSGLVQPQQLERIQFMAPSKPGVYPYVCTYPGHWRRMFGALYVVASKEEYNVDPAKYVEANQLRIQDTLLSMTVSQTEWTVADFEEQLSSMTSGRDFAAGRQIFTAASCISCHVMNGQGKEFGPDLTKLDPNWDTREILSHLIEPSKKIDDKYRTRVILLASGQTVSGLVTFEDDKLIKLVENPVVATTEIVVDKADIDDSNTSEVSLMPKGLLDTLTAEEVLDLLAYIEAKGNEGASIFKAEQK